MNKNSVEFLLRDTSSHGADLSENIKEAYGKLMEEHGDKMKLTVWLPNVSGNKTLEAPSGFVVQVAQSSTPVIADLFSSKMYQGTSLYRIPKNSKFLNNGSMALNEENVIKNLDKLKSLINSAIKEESSKGIALKLIDSENASEKSRWSTEIGSGGGSFAGLYVSNQRGAYNYEQDFWIGIQTSSPSANRELRSLLIEAEEAHTTWDKFFSHENKELSYLQRAMKRNRAIATAEFANAIGLENNAKEIQFEVDVEAAPAKDNSNVPIYKLAPTVETITNVVELYKGNPVYRCGAIDPSQNKNKNGGVIINENPFFGPTILKGPYSKSMEFGKTWEASEKSLGSFPVSTGRTKTTKQLKVEMKKSNNNYNLSNQEAIQSFTWSNGEKNNRLMNGVYRTRDNQFKAIEASLGYDHKNGEINLKPLVVKIASSEN